MDMLAGNSDILLNYKTFFQRVGTNHWQLMSRGALGANDVRGSLKAGENNIPDMS